MRNFLRTKPGHNIYKFNLITQELSIEPEVRKEENDIVSVVKQETCWYESAFNTTDAIAKFNARAKRAYEKVNPPN
jgi:hypothetical protein